MRIISNFKDYYDIGMGYYDDSIVFVRKEDSEMIDFDRNTCLGMNNTVYTHKLFLCGKVYGFVEFKTDNTNKRKFVHNKEQYESLKDERFVNRWFNSDKIDNYIYCKDDTEGTNIKYSSPIVLHDARKQSISYDYFSSVIINPSLKDYQFMKVMDAYTTYQEIEMYLSNVLCNKEQETISFSDDVMLKSKGFYEKSFKHRK